MLDETRLYKIGIDRPRQILGKALDRFIALFYHGRQNKWAKIPVKTQAQEAKFSRVLRFLRSCYHPRSTIFPQRKSLYEFLVNFEERWTWKNLLKSE